MRAFLNVLKVPGAHLVTLKAFRAGKATAMAASGNSLGLIVAAGEWYSAAYLNYVIEQAAEAGIVAKDTMKIDYRALADKANEIYDEKAMLCQARMYHYLTHNMEPTIIIFVFLNK